MPAFMTRPLYLARHAGLMAGLLAGLAAGCATRAPAPAPPAVLPAPSAPPTTTRGEFTLEADKLDTWNAVGQIVVNTPGLEYEGRAQMLDLYSVRYRGEALLLLTKPVLLSDTIRRTTTRITATTRDGRPVDSEAAAELLAQLQEKLPAAIAEVRVKQAAEQAARRAAAKAKAGTPHRRKHRGR